LGILAFGAALGFEAFDFFSRTGVSDPIASSMRLISVTIARSLSPAASPVRFMAYSSPQDDPVSVPHLERRGNAGREIW
jgi:hypothetical protein